MKGVKPINIRHATIFGFGKWIDYTIDFSTNSLTCIYGENESGKSTLQGFFLFMLFGLPPKQRAFYRPKTSGKMGGRLTIYDSAIGEYTIERFDEVKNGTAKCYLADGREFDENWLKKQLKGMTKEIYQSIFSFSALDLNEFKDMKGEDLGEVLLGIGLTGSNNMYSVEKKLENKIGELFKPFGKIPTINQQLEALDERATELMNHKNNEGTYRDKQERFTDLTNEIGHLQTKLRQEKKVLLTIEKHQYALPIINEYHTLKNQLSSYPDQILFPEKGLDRLQVLKETLLPMQSEVSVLKNHFDQYKAEYETQQKHLVESNEYEKAKEIIQGKHNYIENKQDLIRQEETIRKLTLQMNTELDELQIGLTSTDLASIPLPFHIEKKWNQLKNRTEKLALEKNQLQQEQHALEKQHDFLSNELQEIKTKLLSKKQMDALYFKMDANKEYDIIQEQRIKSTKRQKQWQETKVRKQKNSLYFLVGSIFLALLVGVSGLFLSIDFLFNVMIIIFIIGIGQWVWGKQIIKETGDLLAYKDAPQTSPVQFTDEEIQKAEQLLEENNERTNKLSSVKEQHHAIDIQLIKWAERKNDLLQQERQLDEQIAIEYKRYPFLQYVDPLYWPELYHTIKHLVRIERDKRQMEEAYENIQKKVAIFEQAVKTLFQKTKMDSSTKKPIDYQLEILERRIDYHKDAEAILAQYTKRISENKVHQQDIKQKMHTYKQEIYSLFKTANVETEDSFYEMAKLWKEKAGIESKMKQATDQLSNLLPHAAAQELIANRPDQDSLEMDHQQTKDNIEEIEGNIDEKRQQVADLNASLMNMESSETYSTTMHRFNMEQEHIQKLANEWAILKTAKEMLAETKRSYRDKYLNKVIEKTALYFKKITGNAYRSVLAPVDGATFQVESQDQIRYKVHELSQGTIDQLYICLRLAISEIMSINHQFPFIIDDAFVHFDAIRTKRIMEILTHISKNKQIIVFTCKQEVIELLQSRNLIYLDKVVHNT